VEGRPPFAPRQNPIALLQVIAAGKPEPMEHAGPIGGAIAAMMDADPSQRWNMATAAERLARVARGEETLPLPGAAGGAAAAGATQVLSTTNEPTQAMPAPEPTSTPRQAAPAAAPAAAAAAYGASRPAPAGPEPDRGDDDRAGARRWLPLLLALLLVGGLGGAYLVTQGDEDPGSASSGGTTTSTTASTTPEQTTSQEPSPTSEPSTTTTTTTPPTTTSSTTAQDGMTDRQMAKFVRDYFREVTRDRDKTWALLTPEYQRELGRDSYDGFWSTIESVEVRDLETDAEEGIATAQLTYRPKDGDESTERHELTIVEAGDGLLIADDQRG
jgi:hypothetical protein